MSAFDAVVVGRAAIGSVAALAFARAGWRVALVGPGSADGEHRDDGQTLPGAAAVGGWDQRVYALSPASRALLADLGVWQLLDPARVAPVHDMRIFHAAGRTGSKPGSEVHLDAYQGRVEALAWIVENRELQAAIDRALTATPPKMLTRVDAQVDSLTLPESMDSARATASIGLAGGGTVAARLVVAADGGGSRLRQLAGIDHVARDYDQTAIVANFETGLPHRDCAWQWFGGFGVMALLPLPSGDLGHGRGRVSLVWSAPQDEALRGQSAGEGRDAWLAARVQSMTGDLLGGLRLLTPPATFPLRTVRCRQVIKPAFVLIGDAAHTVHPMAGQGMNLGFGDVRGLIDHVIDRSSLQGTADRSFAGRSPASTAADWLTLRRYERSRREPVATMHLALDGLYRAFGDLPAPLVGLRDLGWEIVARTPWLKRRIIAHAVS